MEETCLHVVTNVWNQIIRNMHEGNHVADTNDQTWRRYGQLYSKL